MTFIKKDKTPMPRAPPTPEARSGTQSASILAPRHRECFELGDQRCQRRLARAEFVPHSLYAGGPLLEIVILDRRRLQKPRAGVALFASLQITFLCNAQVSFFLCKFPLSRLPCLRRLAPRSCVLVAGHGHVFLLYCLPSLLPYCVFYAILIILLLNLH